MRKRDKHKPLTGKASKTMTLDKTLLLKLEERANRERTTVSRIANAILRRYALEDEGYFREMARYYYLKFQEFQYLKEQAKAQKQTR